MIKKRIVKLGINRMLIGATLAIVVSVMGASTVYPEAFLMQFAESSMAYTVIRSGIVILLIGLLVSYAPRSAIFRATLGVWAFALTVTAVQLLFTYQMNLIDAAIFAELAVIFAIESLETRSIPVKKPRMPEHRIPVTTV